MTQYLSGFQNEEPTEYHLELAKFHLKYFAYVGFTEDFEDVIDAMHTYFGWISRDTAGMVRDKKTSHPSFDELKFSEQEAIKAANQLDIQLYQHARSLVPEQKRKLERFKKLLPKVRPREPLCGLNVSQTILTMVKPGKKYLNQKGIIQNVVEQPKQQEEGYPSLERFL